MGVVGSSWFDGMEDAHLADPLVRAILDALVLKHTDYLLNTFTGYVLIHTEYLLKHTECLLNIFAKTPTRPSRI